MQKLREIKLCCVSSKIVFTKVKYIHRAKNALNDEFSNRELYFNFTNYFLELKIPSILFRCYFACKAVLFWPNKNISNVSMARISFRRTKNFGLFFRFLGKSRAPSA